MKPDVKPLPSSAKQLINAVELLSVFGQLDDSGMGCAKDPCIAIMCGGTEKLSSSSSRVMLTSGRLLPMPPELRSSIEFLFSNESVEWAAVVRCTFCHSSGPSEIAPQLITSRSRPILISRLRVPACAELSKPAGGGPPVSMSARIRPDRKRS